MTIPLQVSMILSRLKDAGFEAYAVGGCVRDALLGKEPHDWDICTSALPRETEAVFSGFHIIETGMKHGTVTLMLDHTPYEITTFRQDGDYLDHRRPESVSFVKNLRDDLSRRDFTVNAMAVGIDGTIQDPFHGQEDLKNGLIRCVGDPKTRFREDALRILRGLRFAAALGFAIHPDTAQAMEESKELLVHVSPERVYVELTKLLLGTYATRVLGQYGTIAAAVLPEILPAMGFEQKNPYHNRDVWGHTLEALSHAPCDAEIRWALLLHDLGKPRCFTLDSSGIGHFYGHPIAGETMAREILSRLRCDKKTREAVSVLVRCHDYDVPATEKAAKRWIIRFGPELGTKLMEVKRCDCLAHVMSPKSRARLENTLALAELVRQVVEAAPCLSVSNLAVSGRDVLESGLSPGPMVGSVLNALLEDVLEDRCPNQREALLARIPLYIQRLHEKG